MFRSHVYDSLLLSFIDKDTLDITIHPRATVESNPDDVTTTRYSLVRLCYDDIALVRLSDEKRQLLIECVRSREPSIRRLATRVLKNACYYEKYNQVGERVLPLLRRLSSGPTTMDQFLVGDLLASVCSQERFIVPVISLLDSWGDVIACQYAATDVTVCRALSWATCHDFNDSFVTSQLKRHLRPISLAIRVAQGPTNAFVKNVISGERGDKTVHDEQHFAMAWARMLLLVTQRNRGMWRRDLERREAHYILARALVTGFAIAPAIVATSFLQTLVHGPRWPIGYAYVNYAFARLFLGLGAVGIATITTTWANARDRWRMSSARFLRDLTATQRAEGKRTRIKPPPVEADEVVAERIVRRKVTAAAVVLASPLVLRWVVKGMYVPIGIAAGALWWGDCGQYYLPRADEAVLEWDKRRRIRAADRGENGSRGWLPQAVQPALEVARWLQRYADGAALAARVGGWPSRASTVEASDESAVNF